MPSAHLRWSCCLLVTLLSCQNTGELEWPEIAADASRDIGVGAPRPIEDSGSPMSPRDATAPLSDASTHVDEDIAAEDGGTDAAVTDGGTEPPYEEPTKPPTSDAGASDAADVLEDASTASDAATVLPDPSVPLEDGAVPDSDAGASDAGTHRPPVDAGPGTDATAPTFTRVFTMLRQGCRSCHVPGAAFSLDLSTQQLAYEELVGGPNQGAAEFITCANQGLYRVIPYNPDQSLLVQKLEATHSCGDRMPPGGSLSAVNIALVRAWIEAGALDN